MAEKLNQGMIMKTLDYCYEKAVSGLPGLETAQELADSYKKDNGTLACKANNLIIWQNL